MSDNKNPAQIACEAFGGTFALAKAAGVDPSTVSCWMNRSKGIPRNQVRKVLDAAKAAGIDLTIEQLI